MTKATINLQTSHITHGIISGDDYSTTDDMFVKIGYTPSMVKLITLDDSDETIDRLYFYHHEANMYKINATAVGEGASAVELVEAGFEVDHTALAALSAGTPAGFIFEAYGTKKDEYESPMHPDATDGDSAMDSVDHDYLPDVGQGEQSYN